MTMRTIQWPTLILWLLLGLIILLWLPPALLIGYQFITVSIDWQWLSLARVVVITLAQAVASMLLSLVIAIPLALAIVRRNFFGKTLLIRILSLSVILPPIIATFAILAAWGRVGLLSTVWQWLGGEAFTAPFGWIGVLIAHALLNAPFIVRIILLKLDSLPANWWLTCRELQLSAWVMWRWLDWQVIKNDTAAASKLVFLFCLNSFAIIWILGGGPAFTTIEVALFSALRHQFDVSWAVQLLATQVVIVTAIALSQSPAIMQLHSFATPFTNRGENRPDRRQPGILLLDIIALSVGVLLIVLPYVALLTSLFSSFAAWYDLLISTDLYRALSGSISIAVPAAGLGMALSLALAWLLIQEENSRLGQALRFIPLLVFLIPAIALGSAWTLLTIAVGASSFWLILVIILAHAVAVIPIGVCVLTAPCHNWRDSYLPLINELQLSPIIILRLARSCFSPALRQVFVWAMAFSIGDLGLTALFGYNLIPTLPLYMYRLLGSYQIAAGNNLAILMVILFLLLQFFANTKAPHKSPADANRR